MKTIKLIAVALIATFASVTAVAQDKAHFGVRAAYDMTTSTTVTEIAGWGSGFSVGGVYYAPFGKRTFFQTGLLFYVDNIKLDGTTENKYNPHTYDGNIRNLGIRLPIDLGLRILENSVVALNVYTGPHLYFNFASKMICDEIIGGKTNHVDEKFTTSGMEIGWALGVGADFFKRWHIHLEGAYGLSNLGKTDRFELGKESNLKRAEISLGVGYNF
jgi:hypothetical protein